ncbi:MAG: VOC family protein [Bacteroidota bacterium]
MEIDHIFIFSDQEGREADQLVEAGFWEGSSRVHPGQGTRNRKFYFDNFFLELLWVHDKAEIERSATAAVQQLGQRSQHAQNGQSPYGLCLKNAKSSDPVFVKSDFYQPDYFPEGWPIATLPHLDAPQLPWTFRLPFRNALPRPDEPREHHNGVRRLTKATFLLPAENAQHAFLQHFEQDPLVNFETANQLGLILEFDDKRLGKEITMSSLGLSLLL